MRERRDRNRPRHGLVDVTVKVPAEKAGAVRRFAGRVSMRREPARRDDIIENLTPGNHQLAVALAAIPEKIRGFGPVKQRHLAAAKAEETALFERFLAGGAPLLRAAE